MFFFSIIAVILLIIYNCEIIKEKEKCKFIHYPNVCMYTE